MTQLLKPGEHARQVSDILKANDKVLTAMIPPSAGDPRRLLAVAFQAVAYNPAMKEVVENKPNGPITLFAGIVETLKLGIEIGGTMMECWLLPFNDNRRGKIAQLIIGYQGYRNIIGRNRSVISADAKIIFEGDEWDYLEGDAPRIHHKPKRGHRIPPELAANQEQAWNQMVGAYAVFQLRGGGKQIRFMFREEIESHRNRSAGWRGSFSPWKHPQDQFEMARKTPFRAGAKFVPKTTDIARMLAVDNAADAGDAPLMDVSELQLPPDLQQDSGPKLGVLDQLTQAHGGSPTAGVEAEDINWGDK